MSTNKTTNYNLHAWEPGDDFLRSEFNENFAAVDAALHTLAGDAPKHKKLRIVTGSYVGVGGIGLTVELGFRPKAVYVTSKTGGERHALFFDGLDDTWASVTDTGFTVTNDLSITPEVNYPVGGEGLNPYRYIALGWEN